jgi:hypothetical protein
MLTFAAGALGACANVVQDEDPGRGGANLDTCVGENCPSSTSSGDPTPTMQAVAMLYSEVPWSVPGSGSSTSTGGSIHPDTLYIFIRNDGALCADPMAAQGCGGNWGVTIAIPPHLQTPGVYPLSSPDLISMFSATGPDPNDCWFGGGSFIDGDLEILSIDEGQLTISLSNTYAYDFDANGSYTVPRCH